MSGAHRDSLPVEDLRHVVRVDAVDVEGDDPGSVLGRRPVRRDPRELVETPEGVLDEIALVAPRSRRGRRRGRSRRRPRTRPPRRSRASRPRTCTAARSRSSALIETDRIISPPRLNGAIVSRSSLRPQSAPIPLGPHHLVRRDREELAVERLHVERAVRRGLSGVDDHDRVALVRPGGEVASTGSPSRACSTRGWTRPPSRDPRARSPPAHRAAALRTRRSGSPLNIAPVRPATYCHGTKLEWCSRSVTTTRSPGPRLSRPQAYATRFSASVAERVKITSRSDGAFTYARTFPRSRARGRALGEPVDAAVDVRVRVLVELAQRIQDLPRFLRRCGRVEECHRLPVDELVEDGEVRPQSVRVELRLGGHGHGVHRTVVVFRSIGRRYSRRPMRVTIPEGVRLDCVYTALPEVDLAVRRRPLGGTPDVLRGQHRVLEEVLDLLDAPPLRDLAQEPRSSRRPGARPCRQARTRAAASRSRGRRPRCPSPRGAFETGAAPRRSQLRRPGSSSSATGETYAVWKERPSVSSSSVKRSPPSTRMLSLPSSNRVQDLRDPRPSCRHP